ncbi:MAG TPA: GntR family transcriptional regulator [Magnetospirillaceae bacterium]|nr:GntR family transcriptional regulator [Magnetospirillaceae bacterium]
MDTGWTGVIETRSLGEQVYRHFCNLIIEGRLNYGETINSKLLAKEMNVSPMPVREALKRLAVEGLVVIKPRSMCTLRMPTRKSVLDTIAMRELIEVYCVENVYAAVAPEKLATLHGIIRTMSSLVVTGTSDIQKYIQYDAQFHIALCALAENDFIDKTYREVSLHLNMNHTYSIGIVPDIARSYRDHVDLVNALEAHSPEAVGIIRNHLERSRNNVLKGRLFSKSPEEDFTPSGSRRSR